jgi:hypothetical protein
VIVGFFLAAPTASASGSARGVAQKFNLTTVKPIDAAGALLGLRVVSEDTLPSEISAERAKLAQAMTPVSATANDAIDLPRPTDMLSPSGVEYQ